MKRIFGFVIFMAVIALIYLAYTNTATSQCCASTTIVQPVPVPETVITTVGKEFSIELIETPTAGYSWSIDPWDRTLLEQTGSKSIHNTNMIGGTNTRIFTFKARQPGMVELHIKYGRRWEEGKVTPDERVFNVTIQPETGK